MERLACGGVGGAGGSVGRASCGGGLFAGAGIDEFAFTASDEGAEGERGRRIVEVSEQHEIGVRVAGQVICDELAEESGFLFADFLL